MAEWCPLADSAATEALGATLARCLRPGLTLYLHGELGAGKTTLVRGLLHALGHSGAVKSPTYTLVEPYSVAGQRLYHFDLYRLASPEELEYMGIRDYLDGRAVAVVEWPEQGEGVLPPPDLHLWLRHAGTAREVRLEPVSAAGEALAGCVEAG